MRSGADGKRHYPRHPGVTYIGILLFGLIREIEIVPVPADGIERVIELADLGDAVLFKFLEVLLQRSDIIMYEDLPDLFEAHAHLLKIADAVNEMKLVIGVIAISCVGIDVCRLKQIDRTVVAERLRGDAHDPGDFADGVVLFHDVSLSFADKPMNYICLSIVLQRFTEVKNTL